MQSTKNENATFATEQVIPGVTELESLDSKIICLWLMAKPKFLVGQRYFVKDQQVTAMFWFVIICLSVHSFGSKCCMSSMYSISWYQ